MNFVLKTSAIAVTMATFAACTTPQTSQNSSGLSPEELIARNEALLAKEADLARKQAELEDMQRALSQAQADGSSRIISQGATTAEYRSVKASPVAQQDLLPPSANAGECYARVWVEPSYKNVTEEVLIKEASSRIEIIPAQYETVTEQLLVKEASSRMETIPATYEVVSEEKLVQEGGVVWRIDNSVAAAPAGQDLLDKAAQHGIRLGAAQPGDCYHEHFIPAKFETVNEEVMLKQAYDVVEVQEAEYHWVEKELLVSEASSRIEEVPAVYKTVTEQVVDVPAHTIWKKGSGPIQRIDEATGEIMCLVEVPATYKTITKEVLESPATTREIEIPAVYETVKVKELLSDAQEVRKTIPAEYSTVAVTKQVADATFVWHEIHDTTMSKDSRTGLKICLVDQKPRYETVKTTVVKTPAETRSVEIPAVYETREVRKLVSAADKRVIEIPAEYETVQLRKVEKDGFMEWRSILCETNMDKGTITKIQEALQTRGYNPGVIDGVVGRDTMKAVNAFQRDNSLPVDKYLNIETIKALSVNI